MLYCGIFIYFYIPNTSYSISHYIIKIFVIIFLGSQESLFVTLTFFQSQLCLLNFCFYFLTQTKRISHYALVVREKKTINFIKIIKNQRNKISFNGASNYLLLSQILRKAFVISNVDEDEMRLARFWNVQQSLLKKGMLNEKENAIIRNMLNKYEGLKVNKKDYDWQQQLQTIKNALMNGFSITSLSNEKRLWLAKQIQNYKYGRMTEERCAMMIEIFNLLDTNAKRI